MHVPSLLLAAASLPLAFAGGKGQEKKGLDFYAKKAGLKYFGAATDSPGQRERAGHEDAYAKYDQIMWKSGEFGQTTPTNGQKWLFVEPQQGVFNYTEGEIVTSKAQKAGMYLRCHALVWHSQLAPWVEAKTDWTPETLRAAIVSHVTKVARHWKGKCYAWDVVNEALNEDGTYRESVFYKVLGEEYIKLAFQTAAKVDPKAKLYYNDYNLESPGAKVEGAKRIVKMLKAAHIKIDGVGLQAHLIAEQHPTLDQHIDAIKGFVGTGVEVALTELDVRLKTPATAANLAQQKEAYKNIVGACVQVKGCIGVTIWDFYDPFSWVPYVFEGEGAPLLWFEDFSTHPAYDGVVEALTNKTRTPGRPWRT
ncbi:glycoside hydrolase family 10 protein [Apodospora peruviana]|uniref:Beta-xylanase n=1 Tax=Apodospora peruviana TaxID=516989 RepID=A0AAE0IDF2_9PEZI|nr:glycoside hydrolase family 10 protein [Apodospora peruviana]